jgi:outer membrane receptor protein involved in Fe transport
VLFVNYTDSYIDPSSNVGLYDVGSFTTVDLRAGYRFEEAGLLSDTEFTLMANNLFDRDPPFDVAAGGYNANRPFNPLGRLLSVSVRKSW